MRITYCSNLRRAIASMVRLIALISDLNALCDSDCASPAPNDRPSKCLTLSTKRNGPNKGTRSSAESMRSPISD